MPMMPSPLAAAVYAAVKLGGYAVFAHGLNKVSGQAVSPLKFAVAKTALGLVGGVAYVFALAPAMGISEGSDATLFLAAAPVRLLVWGGVLSIFYGFRSNPRLFAVATVLGVGWSYALDGVMWLIYRILPGMVMPFC